MENLTAIIGEYYVWDADLLEGWDNKKLADALAEPLAKLGLKVEIKNSLNSFCFYNEVTNPGSENYKFPWEIEAIELQAERIVSKIIQNAPEEKIKLYCTQNDGDCETCSLVNYGRDCQNNKIENN